MSHWGYANTVNIISSFNKKTSLLKGVWCKTKQILVHKHVKSYILNRKVHYENKYLEWQRQWYKDSLYVSEFKRNEQTECAQARPISPFTHKNSNMLHLFQQTSRYNKSVVQTRYKRSAKLLSRIRKLNTLEPKPGTYDTDETDINYLRCLVLKQTKLNLTQEIKIIYFTIPVNFFY